MKRERCLKMNDLHLCCQCVGMYYSMYDCQRRELHKARGWSVILDDDTSIWWYTPHCQHPSDLKYTLNRESCITQAICCSVLASGEPFMYKASLPPCRSRDISPCEGKAPRCSTVALLRCCVEHVLFTGNLRCFACAGEYCLGRQCTSDQTKLGLCIGVYNRYWHPLARYPGPFLWTCFRLRYVLAMKSGQLHQRLKEFHSTYGPIVRIAPDELSYADERAWDDIYRKRTFFRNKTWFMKPSQDEPHSIFTHREDYHARFRKAFAPGFLDRSLQEQAPVVEAYTDLFIKQMRVFSGKSVDMTRWFNYYTFDLAGDLLFGESFGCLEEKKEHEWVRTAQDFGKSVALIAVLNSYWPLSILLRYFIPREALRRAKMHRQMSKERAQRRLGCKTDRADFVASAMAKGSDDRSGSIRDDEWAGNMAVFVFAASETTSSALTAILRELLKHPKVLDELTREVRKAFSSEEHISMHPASKLNGLQQLDAVLREGLRLDPPVAIGVPRVTPEGGDTICGKWVPGGVGAS